VSHGILPVYAVFTEHAPLGRAILTMFQIPSAANDPVTRTAALLSLECALMSLSYGCLYIVRFGTMRSMYRASRWAEVCLFHRTLIAGIDIDIGMFFVGSTEDQDRNPVERVGHVSGPRYLAGVVHDCIRRLDSVLRLANGCHKRSTR